MCQLFQAFRLCFHMTGIRCRVKIPCEVLLWQYADECHGGDGFDCNETNPNIDLQDILSQCVLPPDTLVA
jgi:hypothetical protein